MTTQDHAALHGIAMDLGGTKIAAARIAEGRIVARAARATPSEATAESLVDEMHALARELDLTDRDPVGIAVTGRLGDDGAWHAVNARTLPNLDGANLARLVRDRFARRVPVRNDALAAALAEHRLGAGRGSAALAYITVSTGVGGGLVLNGVPLTSGNGLAGHVGFSTTRLGLESCGSGRIGTVESVASGRAIIAAARARGQAVACAGDVFAAARSGAEWAKRLIDRSAGAIAELAANLAAILGIDRIVLGGSVGLAAGYLETVTRHLTSEPALFRPQLVTAEFRRDAELLGALLSP